MEAPSALPNSHFSQLSLALRMGSCALLGQDSQSKGVNHGTHSLLTMERGGIHDTLVEGTRATASTNDGMCLIFEKMLYDNAQILGVSAEAWAQQTSRNEASVLGVFFGAGVGRRFWRIQIGDGCRQRWRRRSVLCLRKPTGGSAAGSVPAGIGQGWFDIGGGSHWELGKHVLMRPAANEEALWSDPSAQVAYQRAMKQLSVERCF